MSELTSCNYCNLKRIKARAKNEHKKVKVVPVSYGGKLKTFSYMGGVDVLIDNKKVAWFMELPDHCCC